MGETDLRVGADEFDVGQLDPRQSVGPPVPNRKQRKERFVSHAASARQTNAQRARSQMYVKKTTKKCIV